MWLDGAYLGDPEGYFFPHAYDITDLAGLSSEHVAVRRGDVQPAAGPGRQAQHHRRLPALGLHRRRLEPRRPVAPRAGRAHRAGAHLPSSGSCATRPTTTGRVLQLHAELDIGRHPLGAAAHHRRRPGRAGASPTASPGRQRGHLAVRRRQPRAVVAVVARRRSPSPTSRSRCSPTTSSATPRRCAPACARSALAPLDLHRQRRAAVREGRQPRPDPPGAGRSHARRAPPRRRPGPRGRARPRPRPRPRQPARALRRRRRAGHARLAGLPAAVGLRPQHPPPGHTPGPGDGEPARAPPLGRRLVRPQRAAAPRRRGRPAARRRPTSGATPSARCSRRGTARSSTSG